MSRHISLVLEHYSQYHFLSFNLGYAFGGDSTVCTGAVVGQDLDIGDNVWLLGDRFMKNAYTAFSFDTNAVGFATLA